MYEVHTFWYGDLMWGHLGQSQLDPSMAQQANEAQLANMRAAMNAGAHNSWAPPPPSREEEARKVRDAAEAYACGVPDFAFWYWLCGMVACAAVYWLSCH